MSLSDDPDIHEVQKAKKNLAGVNLRGASLEGIDLERGNLKGAKLENAYLMSACLIGANLSQANLAGANLKWAKLSNADLRGTIFRGTILKGADLRFAQNLTHQQLKEAITDSSTQLPKYLLGEEVQEIEIIPETKDQASWQPGDNPDEELESEEDAFEEEDIELMDLAIISNEVELAYFLASGQVNDSTTETSNENEGSLSDQTGTPQEDQASPSGAEEKTLEMEPAIEDDTENRSRSAITKPESKVEHFLNGLAQSMQSKEELTKIFQKISIQEPDLDEKEITELSESVVRTIQKVVKEAAPAIVRSIIKEEITKVVKTMESDLEEMEFFEITESLIQTIQKILIIQKLIKEVTPDIVRDIIKEEIPKFKKLEEM